jgi:hypothetical protein
MKHHVRAFTALFALALAAGGSAETPPQSAEAAEVGKAIASAKSSRAAGRVADAVTTMTAVLKKYPGNAEGTTFQIDNLLQQDGIPEALAAYDAYATARKRQDVAMLAPVARADLRRTLRQKSGQATLSARAWERLARDGDAEALRALRQASASSGTISPDGLAATLSLAKLRDPAGEARLGELLRSPVPLERAQVLLAIMEADVRGLAPRVVEALSDPDTNVRTAAARAAGVIQAKQAVPKLREMFDNDTPAVKLFVAVALKRLGQTTADTFLEGILNGQIDQLKVEVARAYASATTKSPNWEKAVRALMGGPNEQIRLEAAELLACCDPAAARSFLTAALTSPNPLMRGGAAKFLESRKDLATADMPRKLLGDASETVRIHGAGLTLILAQDAAASGRGRGSTAAGR